mmetsp:Transcript_21427/g.39414  ORF Transcript_21427/g.39414 Transcript_21427/m.39414 type:complete len:208 (+) Transcript_21427:1074-1697(+)
MNLIWLALNLFSTFAHFELASLPKWDSLRDEDPISRLARNVSEVKLGSAKRKAFGQIQVCFNLSTINVIESRALKPGPRIFLVQIRVLRKQLSMQLWVRRQILYCNEHLHSCTSSSINATGRQFLAFHNLCHLVVTGKSSCTLKRPGEPCRSKSVRHHFFNRLRDVKAGHATRQTFRRCFLQCFGIELLEWGHRLQRTLGFLFQWHW